MTSFTMTTAVRSREIFIYAHKTTGLAPWSVHVSSVTQRYRHRMVVVAVVAVVVVVTL